MSLLQATRLNGMFRGTEERSSAIYLLSDNLCTGNSALHQVHYNVAYSPITNVLLTLETAWGKVGSYQDNGRPENKR